MSQSLYLNNGSTFNVADITEMNTGLGAGNTCYTLSPNGEPAAWINGLDYITNDMIPHTDLGGVYGLIYSLSGRGIAADRLNTINLILQNGAFVWGNIYDGGLYVYRWDSNTYGICLFAGHGVDANDPTYDIFYLYDNGSIPNWKMKAISILYFSTQSRLYALTVGDYGENGEPVTFETRASFEHNNPLDESQITGVNYPAYSKIPITESLVDSTYTVVTPLVGDSYLATLDGGMNVNVSQIEGYEGTTFYSLMARFDVKGYADDPTYLQNGSWWGGDSNIVSDDPNKGATNTTGGGGGVPSNYSDDVGLPDATQFDIDATDTGFVTIFNPTATQMLSFNQWLFASITESFWDNLKKILQDPLDFVIGAGIIKYKPTVKTALQEIKFNGIGTGVFSDIVQQWEKVDCGSVEISEQFKSYLDYNGFSDVKIFLPFCGIQSLDINDVMGGTIHVIYYIDNMTGSCLAHVNINRSHRSNKPDDSHINSVLYKFSGNVMQQLPLTNKDYSGMISAMTSLATSGIAAASTGGAATLGLANQVAGALDHLKPTIQRSGNLGSNYGMMDYLKPYLILERPIRSIPANYAGYVGYPSASTVRIGSCKGFTKGRPATSWASNIHATDAEKQEIKDLIEGGIYV